MTFFCDVGGSRGFRHQIEGDQQVLSILVIARELRCVCVPIDRLVSVSFIAEFYFTAPFFNLYLFVSANKENKEIMNSYKELHIVLTLRRLMSYINGAPILDVSRSHTTTQQSR